MKEFTGPLSNGDRNRWKDFKGQKRTGLLLEEELAFEALISSLSGRFVSALTTEIDSEIEGAIRRIAEFLDLDQGLLVQWGDDAAQPVPSHSWTIPEGMPAPTSPGTEVVPWVHRQAVSGRVIMFSSVDDLPEEAKQDKEFFHASGRKALISVPLEIGGKVIGSLVFANLRSEIIWHDEVVRKIQLIANVFAGVLDRQKNKRELEDRLRFEMLLAETSARLINIPADELDNEVRDTLSRVCRQLEIDCSTIWLLSEDGRGTMQMEHLYDRRNTSIVRQLDGRQLFPWTLDKVLSGETLAISKLSDMPPEAARDKESFLSFSTKSALVIPLSAGGVIFGALGFAASRKEREWQDPLASRLKLMAQIFANAFARRNAERVLCERKEQLRERIREIDELRRRIEDENVYLQGEVKYLSEQAEIVGESAAMRMVLTQASQVAGTESTVLIQGETGTGKELLARAIHKLSCRKDRPLITVNCAALPPTLIESELFGREKGAYTGALTRMAGRFEIADGSSIFLDEIGEFPLELQGKLLRVIEEGTFERVGSTKPIHVDVRIIAATNRDLASEMKEGKFRKDVFYRLNVFPIVIPPLRERPEDIPLMVWAFVREFQKRMGKRIDSIPRKTMEALQSYKWPGNGRELRNVIERAMIVSSGKTLEVLLPEAAGVGPLEEEEINLANVERRHIISVLEKTSWRVTGKGGAAEVLGLKGTTLQSKMKKLGIKRPATFINKEDRVSTIYR